MNAPRRERLLNGLTVAACAALTLAFVAPTIWYCPGASGVCEWAFARNSSTDDWRYFAGVWEAARVALSTFHEFPSWNPYHCGGIVLFQDPQAPFPGPLFLMTFAWLPAVAAMKTWLLAHLFAGALGARALVREQGANRPEQILAAALTVACGFCGEHFGGGHLSFTPFLFFPWLLLGQRRALRDARWGVLVAALLALVVYEGGTYPLPLMLVGLGIDLLLRVASPSDRRGLAAYLPVLGALFPLLAALRLLPILHYLAEHPRLVPLDDQMTVAEVLQTWLVRVHERAFAGHVFVWPEYGDYVGPVPVLLGALGLVGAVIQRDERARDRRIDLAVFAGLIWCALGNLPGFSLFGLLHELPIYKSLRVPSRFLYPATVMLAVLAARGLADLRATMLAARWKPSARRVFVAGELALAIAVVADLCAANSRKLQAGIDPDVPRVAGLSDFYQGGGGDYWRWSTYPARGIGTTQCYVPLEWGPAPGIWSTHDAQFRVVPPDAGTVRQTAWTANSVRFAVALRRPAVLTVNQNHETGWTTDVGEIDRALAMLTVNVPAGRHTLTLRHRPRGLAAGSALTLAGLLLSIAVLRRLTPAAVDALRSRVRRRFTEAD